MVHNRVIGATMALRRTFVGQYNLSDATDSNNTTVFHDHIIYLSPL